MYIVWFYFGWSVDLLNLPFSALKIRIFAPESFYLEAMEPIEGRPLNENHLCWRRKSSAFPPLTFQPFNTRSCQIVKSCDLLTSSLLRRETFIAFYWTLWLCVCALRLILYLCISFFCVHRLENFLLNSTQNLWKYHSAASIKISDHKTM